MPVYVGNDIDPTAPASAHLVYGHTAPASPPSPSATSSKQQIRAFRASAVDQWRKRVSAALSGSNKPPSDDLATNSTTSTTDNTGRTPLAPVVATHRKRPLATDSATKEDDGKLSLQDASSDDTSSDSEETLKASLHGHVQKKMRLSSATTASSSGTVPGVTHAESSDSDETVKADAQGHLRRGMKMTPMPASSSAPLRSVSQAHYREPPLEDSDTDSSDTIKASAPFL